MDNQSAHSEISFWQISLPELVTLLNSSENGLSKAEAEFRFTKFGPNLINAEKKHLLIVQFLKKFQNPLVIILLVASALSASSGDLASFFIIAVIVILSVSLDFFQEYRAGTAAQMLRESVRVHATVFREGQSYEIPIEHLVPGDMILLSAGDIIPGDGRLVDGRDFFVDQSHLTGESYPVEKFVQEKNDSTDVLTAANTVLLGSSVVSGSAKALICRTGQKTCMGGIAESLSAKAPITEFEKGIQNFGSLIMRMTIFLVLFVLLINTFFHRSWSESFLFALALAVGLTPELLPMIVSVTLSKGAIRMAKEKVIVKRLSSIHNLGSMNIFCTDKTGTLTEAKIHLERHVNSKGVESERVLELAYYNSFFESGLKSPLDAAILEHETIDVSHCKKIDEVPFDFERRRVSVLIEKENERMLIVKGAPEDLIKLSVSFESGEETKISPMTKESLASINEEFEKLSKDGFRVLGIAYKKVPPSYNHAVVNDESELIFAGFAGFLDPPKISAKNALLKLKRDNVDVKIITGDNQLVTQHICSQLDFDIKGILTGSEIEKMNEPTLAAVVERVNIFCRMNPAQKNRIILALKSRGHVVGYLGDGINDAPSLHSADVGISVDTAVDVAKEAADMILLEHDLRILHSGVLEGRRTFGNIIKYIMMGTSSNFGNMFSMAGASLFLPFIPMLPLQILLNNLLYDISELPIPLDNVDPYYLKKPHRWDMKFIRNFMFAIGPISSLFDFLTFYLMLKMFQANERLFHTGWFIESMATQVLVIFVIRTKGNPFKSHPHPWLVICAFSVVVAAALIPLTPYGIHLGFTEPSLKFFMILIVMLVCYLIAVEMAKNWFYRRFQV